VQYWSNVDRYGSNIGPILADANIGPTLGRNIGPISCITWGIALRSKIYRFYQICKEIKPVKPQLFFSVSVTAVDIINRIMSKVHYTSK